MWPQRIYLKSLIQEAYRSLFWYTPLRRYMYRPYSYNFTPEQLAFFVRCISETREVHGDVIEVGCETGHTTCFLNRHLQTSGIAKDYYCIDTFSGFLPEDISFEVKNRGKKWRDYSGFRVNRVKWFEYMLKQNGCTRIFCVETDVQKYQFRRPVSFCLLDVDLYRPTLYALENIWPMLSPGGIIVVDDCKTANQFDGALQAYTEFTESRKIPQRFLLDKLGILRKEPASGPRT